MKLKLMRVALATTVTLAGCGITNNDDGLTRDSAKDPNTNVEQTRFNDQANNNRLNERNMNTYNNDRIYTRNLENGNKHYDISKKTADKITAEVNDIDRAYVLTVQNNAYVGIVMYDHHNNDHANRNDDRTGVTNHNAVKGGTHNAADRNEHNVTDEVKRQVADVVKSVDNNIDNVYVTTNPEFIDLTTDYANDIRNGHPVEGVFDQIGHIIQHVFPTNHR